MFNSRGGLTGALRYQPSRLSGRLGWGKVGDKINLLGCVILSETKNLIRAQILHFVQNDKQISFVC